MDAVELARKRAKSLHDQAVERGSDPWSPYQFVVGIADELNICLESCSPDAALLDGARAIFESSTSIILHENVGTPFEQAFLVAHEIGHAVLGDGEEYNGLPFQIDPARASEASPVGIDRVVDYSHRQRREVQMDLFARELLLPRPLACELHVNQGLTCSDIAEHLGAPFDVVAQQLLDALLLPSIPDVVPNPQVDETLSDEQREAIGHRGTAFLLQAGPGTGKTRTLVARVESLLDEGVDPRRILLLTFSNKAAAEVKERIALKRPQEAAALWIGTFHSFGLDILRRFNDRCGLPDDPHLIDRTDAVELLENEFPRLGLCHYRNIYDPSQIATEILTAISRAKDEVTDAHRYHDFAKMMSATAKSQEDMVAAEKAMEVATVYLRYEELKADKGCIDFGDLVMRPVELLEADDSVRIQLQNAYDHVLVDEYQDVNRSSVRLLLALTPRGKNLWVVGDSKQSIYRFRGASSFNMTRFGREDFPGAIRKCLTTNYRSTPEVVEAFSKFATDMSASDGLSTIKAHRESSNEQPELITVTQKDMLAPALAERIQQLRKDGFSYSDQAVLCRGNDSLSKIGQALERTGVPVLFLGSLFERPEVKDLVAMLSLLVDRRAAGLVRVACLPEFAMGLEDVVSVVDYLRETNAEVGAWRDGVPGLPQSGLSALTRLHKALVDFNAASQPWTVLATLLLDRTRQAARIASPSNVQEQAQGIAIWQFMNFVRVQPSGMDLPIQRLSSRIRRLIRLCDDRDLRQLPTAAQGIDAVRLMTIHGSKGLEFPVVHVVGVNDDIIPGPSRASKCPPPAGMVTNAPSGQNESTKNAHLEEQECLFFVAMSRTMKRLAFYGITTKSNGSARKLSRFLDRIAPVTQREVVPSVQMTLAPDCVEVPIVFSGIPRFSAHAIATYGRCARRFLYMYLLQLGGYRDTSPFIQMHNAVRDVFRAVIAQGNNTTGECEELLTQAFITYGLHDHGYVEEYRGQASAMLQYFLESRAGSLVETPVNLSLTSDSYEIEVLPDEILVRDGIRTIRLVKTQHVQKANKGIVGDAAFVLAARMVFPDATVEHVYLADGITESLGFSDKKLKNGQKKIDEVFQGIRNGWFRREVSDFTCPNCPAFFVCGALPKGTLTKLF